MVSQEHHHLLFFICGPPFSSVVQYLILVEGGFSGWPPNPLATALCMSVCQWTWQLACVFTHIHTLDSVACAQCVLDDTTDGEAIIPLSHRAYILEFH